MSDQVRRFQLVVAGCATVALPIAALLSSGSPASVRSPVVVLAMFGLAAAVVSFASPQPAPVTGLLCGTTSVAAMVGYLLGQPWAPWLFVGAAVTAAVTMASIAARPRVR